MSVEDFGGVERLVKRFKKAQARWEQWRPLHQEAMEYAAPNRETFYIHHQGEKKNRRIWDATAVNGLVVFANTVQAAMVPSWMQWMELQAGEMTQNEKEKEKLNEGLEIATNAFFSQINHSNFSTEITPALQDLGIGTGAILVEEETFGRSGTLRFTNVPLAELYPEKPASGRIRSVWRKQELEVGHIQETWPKAELSDDLKRQMEKDPQKEVKILNGFLFNSKDERYYQVVIYEAKKQLLFTQSFDTQRLIVFRWHVTPGEVFGRGPIIQVLPDIKTANKVKEFTINNAALQMAGVYTGLDDGMFNPHTVRISPGTIIPVSTNSNQNPSLRALERSGDLGLGQIVLDDLQTSINKALLVEPLGDVNNPVKTATENIIRNQENLKQRGASFGRMKSELIEPLVTAVTDILVRRGKMPKIKVDGQDTTLRMTSPLAKAEDIEDFQNSQLWFSTISQLPEEIVAGSVRVEDLPKYWAEKLSVPAKLNRDDAEKAELAKQVSQAAEQQLEGGISDITAIGGQTEAA